MILIKSQFTNKDHQFHRMKIKEIRLIKREMHKPKMEKKRMNSDKIK
jgi:hypothetical protein